MSLDGYVAGPNQSLENPLGVGGMRLHEWVFPLAAWRRLHGQEGGEDNASTPVIEESVANISSDDIRLHSSGIGGRADLGQYLITQGKRLVIRTHELRL